MRKTFLAIVLAFLTAVSVLAIVGCDDSGKEGALRLEVENVPASAYVGQTVQLPAATATDGAGKDVSASVKLTVQQLKEDGEIYKEPIFEQPGNVTTDFTPAGRYLDYKIVYKVSAGEESAKKEFDFKALADTEAPVLSLDDEHFDLSKGIAVTETEDISLPKAKGIDKPLNNDVTARISVIVKDKANDAIVMTVTDVTTNEPFRLIRGDYRVVYTLSDMAQNAATPLEFDLKVSPLDHRQNLMLDQKNFTMGFDSRFNSFGELEIGKTANGVTSTGMSLTTFSATKIFDQIVAMNVKFDRPSANAPESFYDIAFRGSNNHDSYVPTGQEGEWPPYLIVRISDGKITLLGTSRTQVNMQYTNANGANYSLFDGAYHDLYLKMTSIGASAAEEGAKIVVSLWVDVVPSETPTVSAYVTRGATNAEDVPNGVLGKDDFDLLWNQNSGAGWLTFAGATWAVGSNGLFGDDRMTIKSLTVYPADEEAFQVDLRAPVVTIEDLSVKTYKVNTQITFPAANAADEGNDVSDKLKIKIVGGGTEIVLDAKTFTPTVKGVYTAYYFVEDAAHNIGYAKLTFKVSEDDAVPPVIDVDDSAFEVEIGEAFTLPAASVSDNIDGDLSGDLIIDVVGPYRAEYIGAPGDTYTLYAAGDHTLVYYVFDFAGNLAEKKIVVHVTGAKTGNLLNDTENFVNVSADKTISLSGDNEQGAYYKGEYVYEQKVSMVMKVSGTNPLILVNLRGEYRDDIWVKGLTMKLQPSGIFLGTYGHDVQNFGSAANPFALDYNRDAFVLFEYRTNNILVEGEEYVRVRAWFDGKEIEWKALGVGALSAEGGVMIKVSDLDARSRGAAHAGQFYITCLMPGASLIVKEVRIDGKDVESDYVSPVPPEEPYHGPEGDVQILAKSGDETGFSESYQALNKLGAERMTFKLKFSDLSANALTAAIQLMGADSYWGNGIALKAARNRLYLTMGGWANGIVAESKGEIVANLFSQNDVYTYIDVLITYITDDADKIVAFTVEVWTGTSRDALTKVEWINSGGDYVREGELYLSVAALREKLSAEQIDANSPVYLYYYGYDAAGEGAGSLVVGKIDFASNMAADTNDAPVKKTFTLQNSATQKIMDTSGGEKVSLKIQCNNYAKNDLFILQVAGNEFTHYGNGLVFYIFNDGAVYFAVGSMGNHANLVAYAKSGGNQFYPDCWEPENKDWHTIDFCLTYRYEGEEIVGVAVDFWYDGAKLDWTHYGTSTGVVDASGSLNVSYDAEVKDWSGNIITDKTLFETDGVYMEYIANDNQPQYNVQVEIQ